MSKWIHIKKTFYNTDNIKYINYTTHSMNDYIEIFFIDGTSEKIDLSIIDNMNKFINLLEQQLGTKELINKYDD